MLKTQFTADTEFPLPGSTGFIRDTCEQVRILQLNRDGSLLVGNVERFASRTAASGSKRVAREDLFEQVEQALHGTLTPPALDRYGRPPTPKAKARQSDPPRKPRARSKR